MKHENKAMLRKHPYASKLTPAGKSFHLNKNHAFISTWEASNYGFVEVYFFEPVILRWGPFTVAST